MRKPMMFYQGFGGGGGGGMGGGAGMYTQILGGLIETIAGLAGGFGSKPNVSRFRRQLLPQAQSQAIGANIGAFPQINQLGKEYTSSLLDSLQSQGLDEKGLISKGSADTSKLLDLAGTFLHGELPQDVIDQIQRSSAYQSLSGGFAGSGMAHALTARDLGLTSLDLMRQGAQFLGQGGNSAQQWASNARGNILDPRFSLINPEQQQQANMANEFARQTGQQNVFNQRAAPDPTMLGLMAISSQFTGGSPYGGNMYGPGGYGGAYAAPGYFSPGNSGLDPAVFGFG